MSKPIIKIVNVSSGEEFEREMNDEEFAQYESDQEAEANRIAELEAKAEVRQAILDRLGLTEQEARLLLG